MKKDIVEVLDSQTAKTKSEQTDIASKEVEEIKTEVAHICKSKCDSCEFDYQERSIV